MFSGSISPGSTISLTSAIVTFEAVAIAGLKALDVPIYSRLPKVSDLFALINAKSADRAFSNKNVRLLNFLCSLFCATIVPTPVGV